MKHSTALVLAIVIFAAIAVCFLRPAPPEDGVYTFFEPMRVELVGEKWFEIEVVGISQHEHFPQRPLIVSIRSRDGRYYLPSDARWEDGELIEATSSLGVVERFGQNGWEMYRDMASVSVHPLMKTPTNIAEHLISPTGDKSDAAAEGSMFNLEFPMWEAGRYRVKLTFRPMADDLSRSLDELVETYFEYEVPERGDEPLEELFVCIRHGTDHDGSECASLSAILYTTADIRYIQPSTIKFERLDRVSGKYENVVIPGGAVRRSPSLDDLKRANRNAYGFFNESAYGDMTEMVQTMVPLDVVYLYGWNTCDEYRFSVVYATNPDGSGEQYTLMLRLRFEG